jgi:hypothetical protein
MARPAPIRGAKRFAPSDFQGGNVVLVQNRSIVWDDRFVVKDGFGLIKSSMRAAAFWHPGIDRKRVKHSAKSGSRRLGSQIRGGLAGDVILVLAAVSIGGVVQYLGMQGGKS